MPDRILRAERARILRCTQRPPPTALQVRATGCLARFSTPQWIGDTPEPPRVPPDRTTVRSPDAPARWIPIRRRSGPATDACQRTAVRTRRAALRDRRLR